MRFRTTSRPVRRAPRLVPDAPAPTFGSAFEPIDAPTPTPRFSRRTVLAAAALLVLLGAAALTVYLTRPMLEPRDTSVLTNDRSPQLLLDVTNPGGLQADEVRATVDGEALAQDRIAVTDSGTRIALTPSGLDEGTYDFAVEVGPVGVLRRTLETSMRVTIDTTAPALRITQPLPVKDDTNPYVADDVVLAKDGTVRIGLNTEAGTALRVESSADDVTAVEAPASEDRARTITATVGEGLQTLRVQSIDAAGNVGTRTLRVLADTTGPAVVLRAPRIVKDDALALPIDASDPMGVSLSVQVNGRVLDDEDIQTVAETAPPGAGGGTPPVDGGDGADAAGSDDSGDDGDAVLPVRLQSELMLVTPALQGRSTLEIVATDSEGRKSTTTRTIVVDSGETLADVGGLRVGAKGGDVRELHEALIEQDVATQAQLGRDYTTKVFGAPTKAAVSRYQQREGMGADGIAGAETVAGMTLRIVVDRGSHTLTLYRMGDVEKTYKVAVGSPEFPTPAGEFSIQSKVMNPTWTPPDSAWAKDAKVTPPGPDNPLGTRWMAIAGTVGIHGTNSPESLGFSVSHGCIRMAIPDVEDLFDRVAQGTRVDVV